MDILFHCRCGVYQVDSSISPGVYDIDVQTEGYVALNRSGVYLAENDLVDVYFWMVEGTGYEGYVIGLSWGSSPDDLDAHTFMSCGCHLYYGEKGCWVSGSRFTFHSDASNGYGPEVTEWNGPLAPGVYQYWAHMYNGGSWGQSNATVDIYFNESLLETRYAPDVPNDWWLVFELDVDEDGNHTYKYPDSSINSEPSTPVSSYPNQCDIEKNVTLQGIVGDSLTFERKEQILVEVYQQVYNDYVFFLNVNTSSSGYFQVSTLPVGRYLVKINLDGYAPLSRQIVVKDENIYLHLWLSPELPEDSYRAILFWNTYHDLDANSYATCGSVECKSNYLSLVCDLNSASLELNSDSYSGGAPETSTWKGTLPIGIYDYYVRIWGSGEISDTKATVDLYKGNEHITTISAPSDSARALTWNPFRVTVSVEGSPGAITYPNTFSSTMPSGFCNNPYTPGISDSAFIMILLFLAVSIAILISLIIYIIYKRKKSQVQETD
eukprot:TRINITY_DN1208_c0_g1_i3.p1 TRINITY_DN1208_c0_g1~~TRINITY_DN1208_c0_g1_i3.p1  ORF type:complete len:493 (-),score=68.59 TRINITY_DN1208_c0_g1_i3:48-1526(-)